METEESTRRTISKSHKPKAKAKGNKQKNEKPSWLLPKEQWAAMTQEQHDAHRKKHQKKTRNVNKAKSDQQNNTCDSASYEHEDSSTAVDKLMSTKSANKPSSVAAASVTYKLSTTKVTYHFGTTSMTCSAGSLIDGGANGGLAGSDVRLISTSNTTADVTGINDTLDVPIGTVAGLIDTTEGPAIAVMHQYAYVNKGHTIHSVNQLESFGLTVDDKPKYNKGTQCIVTPDGFVIPLAVRLGLTYMDMRPPSDAEYESLPHITSDATWDPSVLDSEVNMADCRKTVICSTSGGSKRP